MLWSTSLLAAVLAAIAVSTAGCTMHKVKTDRKVPVKLPEQLAEGGPEGPDRWWIAFGDDGLNRLVMKALRDNYDLRRTWARLEQSAAVARQTGAASLPTVQASADAQYSQRALAIGNQVIDTAAWQFPLSVSASYELDLWGRVRATRAAAATDVAATRQDLSAMAMTVAARVGDTWLSLIERREQKRLIEEQIKISEQLLQVVQGRFAQGLVSAVDVLQQRQQVETARGQLPLVDSAIGVLTNQLRALLGMPPRTPLDVPEATRIPELPPMPAVAEPAKLLDRRPDVRAARLRVLAADHRVGVALANRFPTLRLSGQAGVTGVITDKATTLNPAWSLAAGVARPLFDGGRLGAEHDRTKIALRDSVLAWAQAIVRALHEVDDALTRERQQRAHIAGLQAQLTTARKTFDESKRRYMTGVGDFVRVLAAEQSVQRLQRSLLSARRQLLSHRVSLHRAMGGGWTSKLVKRSERDGA